MRRLGGGAKPRSAGDRWRRQKKEKEEPDEADKVESSNIF